MGDVDEISQEVDVREAAKCHMMSGASRGASESVTDAGMCVDELNALRVICNKVSIFVFYEPNHESCESVLFRCVIL